MEQLGFFGETLFTTKEINKILADQAKFFIQISEFYLSQYHKVLRTASSLEIPSMTTNWSSIPQSQESNISKIEIAVIKKITAKEWLLKFRESLDRLPVSYRNLIEIKYLNRCNDGTLHSDDYVYDALAISRASYYKKKPIVLEEFGRIIHNVYSLSSIE